MVVDEYQDISEDEYNFLQAIVSQSENVRVIVVGDDDQNIYEFRGSSVQYMKDFVNQRDAKVYYLSKNYRSKNNIVGFANKFLENFSKDRIKRDLRLIAHTIENGTIKITKHNSSQLITPVVENIIKSHPVGTTAVLTRTNEEALLVYILLNEKNIPAQFIASNEGFKLKDLIEIRSFSKLIQKPKEEEYGLITKDEWELAKDKFKSEYSK